MPQQSIAMPQPLNLFVNGVQTLVLQKPETKKVERVRRVKEVKIAKVEVAKDVQWDVESEQSVVVDQPSIWVEIVQKVIEQSEEQQEPQCPDTPSIPSPRSSLPDSFQNYLKENFRLIAEIQTAKKRRLFNRNILKVAEENVNWTSNAPKPCKPPFLIALAKLRQSGKSFKEFPSVVRGVCLQVRAQERVQRKTRRGVKLKKKNSIESREFGLHDDEWVDESTGCEVKKKKKKVKRKKKGKKTLRRSASSKSKERSLPPKNAIPDAANVVSDYEEDHLVHDMISHQADDTTTTSHTETMEEKHSNKELEEKYAAQNDTTEDIAQQIEELEENLRNIKVDDADEERQHQQHEIIDYPDPYRDTDWLNFPRAGQTFGARFELPIDLRKLKNMAPVDYLGLHVVSTRCRQRLNEVVYERHAKECFLPSEGLLSALAEILGFRLDKQSEEKLYELIQLEHDRQLNGEQFSGIGALAERIARADISERDDLEISDFNLLKTKLSYLEMSDELRRLFLFIGGDV